MNLDETIWFLSTNGNTEMKDQPSYKEQVSTPLERISALLDKSFRINFVEIYEIW